MQRLSMQAKPAQQGLASSQKKPAPMHWSISRPQWTVSSSNPLGQSQMPSKQL
jgi:hypothetical protein